MLQLCSTSTFDERAWLCTLSRGGDSAQAPGAFALIHDTPELRESIGAAYELLAEGRSEDVEIPLSVAMAPARAFDDVSTSLVPHVHALKAAVDMLAFQVGDQPCRPANDKIAEAFERVARRPRRPNAVLVVSRDEPPLLRATGRAGHSALATRPMRAFGLRAWTRPAGLAGLGRRVAAHA